MAAFDQLREEFDRLSREEQIGLSIQGLFSTYRQGGGQQQSNKSLFSDATLEADLSKKSSRQMSSFMASQTYRVKIRDVLGDVVEPLGDLFEGTSSRDRLHLNNLHHESTLYYQGIIDAIEEQGRENRAGFIRSTVLGYERFRRSPVWSSINVLGKVASGMLKFSLGTLFGFDVSIEKKMLEELEKHTEYFKSGNISDQGFFKRLKRQGVLGMVGRRAFSEIKTGIGMLLPSKKESMSEIDIATDTNEKTKQILDVLKTTLYTQKNINENLKTYGDGIINVNLLGFSDNGVMSQLFNASMNYQMNLVEAMSSMNQTTDDMFGGFNEYRENWKDYQEQTFDVNQDVRDELVEHNKREKRRTFMGILGKVFGGIKSLVSSVAGFISSFPTLISAAIGAGFSGVLGDLTKSIGRGLKTAFKSFFTSKIFMATITLAIRAAKTGFDKALTWAGMGLAALGLTGTLATGTALAALIYPKKTAGEDKAGFGGYSEDTTFTPTIMNRLTPIYNEIARLKKERELAKEERKGYERSDRLIEVNKKIAEAEQRLIDVRKQAQKDWDKRNKGGQVSPIALYSAERVSPNVMESNRSSDRSSDYSGILKAIRMGESQNNYNNLVYGKKGRNVPNTAPLTDMTIGQVMDYQSSMLKSGHASTAVGGYQFTKDTLKDMLKATGGVDRGSMFDKKTQDKLAKSLLKEEGLNEYESGGISRNRFRRNIAGRWASLPDKNDKSLYEGKNQNSAVLTTAQINKQLENLHTYQETGLKGIAQQSKKRYEDSKEFVSDASKNTMTGFEGIIDNMLGGQLTSSIDGLVSSMLGVEKREEDKTQRVRLDNDQLQVISNAVKESGDSGDAKEITINKNDLTGDA